MNSHQLAYALVLIIALIPADRCRAQKSTTIRDDASASAPVPLPGATGNAENLPYIGSACENDSSPPRHEPQA